jgi:transcription initiation factor TFIID TATA-box-binding protein
MSESCERSGSQETIELQNVVASTGIEQELDLESVAMDLHDADYNPENFPGIVYRTEGPRAATLLFRSRKMVATGASSVEDVHATLNNVFEDLRKFGIEIGDDPEITVQNMVASADLGQRLNLNAIAIGLGLENGEYEPEQFPGLVYRVDEPSVVVLLFGSGKMLVTGVTVNKKVEHAVEMVESRLTDLILSLLE